MRYFAEKENGVLIGLGIGMNGEEITETQYNALMDETLQKSDLVYKVYMGYTAIETVQEEWREEIQQRVNLLQTENGPADQAEISDAEALAIILGGEEG